MMVRATFTDGSRGVQRIVSAPMQREDFDGLLEMRRPCVWQSVHGVDRR